MVSFPLGVPFSSDLIIYCTGYHKSYDYLPGEMRAKLELQKVTGRGGAGMGGMAGWVCGLMEKDGEGRGCA